MLGSNDSNIPIHIAFAHQLEERAQSCCATHLTWTTIQPRKIDSFGGLNYKYFFLKVTHVHVLHTVF